MHCMTQEDIDNFFSEYDTLQSDLAVRRGLREFLNSTEYYFLKKLIDFEIQNLATSSDVTSQTQSHAILHQIVALKKILTTIDTICYTPIDEQQENKQEDLFVDENELTTNENTLI